jgi:NAD-dependent deacetylase
LEIPQGLIRALAASRRPVVLTGAGMSAESGVPTFRDALDGLWARFRPEELATPEAFADDPELVWRWYGWRRELVSAAAPNAGHLALVGLDGLLPGLRIVTQNVDGLHQRAGSDGVVELHGNLFANLCSRERAPVPVPAAWAGPGPPPCPRCGAPVRPGVVWFGEPLPPAAISEAETLAAGADVFFSVGTSSLVTPAANLPYLALAAGATVIEINPEPTSLAPHCEYTLAAPSGVALPAVLARLTAILDAGETP